MKKQYETECYRIKLKPGSLDKVNEWASELNSRKEEALATLRDERVIVESVFLEQTDEGDYLIFYMKVNSFEKVREAVAKSQHPIDDYHQNFKKATWESGQKLKMLVDFDLIGEG